jgi:hypothetical protein
MTAFTCASGVAADATLRSADSHELLVMEGPARAVTFGSDALPTTREPDGGGGGKGHLATCRQ